jgi:NAD+ kinase
VTANTLTASGTSATGRVMLLVAHTGRPAARRVGRALIGKLEAVGIGVRVLQPEAEELGADIAAAVPVTPTAAVGTEMVLAVGGDGTLLRAAELARPARVPLLGVNLGHVGFLAEAEPEDLAVAVANIAAHQYSVERRMTVDVTVRINGGPIASTWALNEATVEKAARERMLDLVIEVDGRPLSRWGCDGVVFATPTGSTAYAFSAGGPVVWPEVEALLMVPISAHALFARPMVVSPMSVLAAEVIGAAGAQGPGATAVSGDQAPVTTSNQSVPGHSETAGAVLWCDGRRMVELPPGSRVEVRRGSLPVLLARLPAVATGAAQDGASQIGGEKGTGTEVRIGAPFTDRLVVKFGLPVAGWRGQPGNRIGEDAAEKDGAGNESAGKGGAVAADDALADDTSAGDVIGEDTLARDAFSDRADEEPGRHA